MLARPPAPQPLAAGRLVPLSMEERGMMRSVLWHRDEAPYAYNELLPADATGATQPVGGPR